MGYVAGSRVSFRFFVTASLDCNRVVEHHSKLLYFQHHALIGWWKNRVLPARLELAIFGLPLESRFI